MYVPTVQRLFAHFTHTPKSGRSLYKCAFTFIYIYTTQLLSAYYANYASKCIYYWLYIRFRTHIIYCYPTTAAASADDWRGSRRRLLTRDGSLTTAPTTPTMVALYYIIIHRGRAVSARQRSEGGKRGSKARQRQCVGERQVVLYT